MAHDGGARVKPLLLALLRSYQWVLRPVLGPRCRFFPSCSDYAMEAIAVHGSARGSYLAACRLCRCHPWSEGGLDPVPPRPHLKQLWIPKG
jgi:uncharacterized protein